jgi:hypothetical protein
MQVKLTEIQETIRFGTVVGGEKWGDKNVRPNEDRKLSTNVKSFTSSKINLSEILTIWSKFIFATMKTFSEFLNV